MVCVLKQHEQSLIAQVNKKLSEIDQISYTVTLLLLYRVSIRDKLCEGRTMLHQSHSMTRERIQQEEQDKRRQMDDLQSHVRVHFHFRRLVFPVTPKGASTPGEDPVGANRSARPHYPNSSDQTIYQRLFPFLHCLCLPF